MVQLYVIVMLSVLRFSVVCNLKVSHLMGARNSFSAAGRDLLYVLRRRFSKTIFFFFSSFSLFFGCPSVSLQT